MSLLLDALKKAALEKQKRDQESQDTDVSSAAVISAVATVSAEQKRDIFTKKISGSSSTQQKIAEPVEELIFDIEETHFFEETKPEELTVLVKEEIIKEDIISKEVKDEVKKEIKKEIKDEVKEEIKEPEQKIEPSAKREEPLAKKEEPPTKKDALADMLESSRQAALSSAYTADGSQAPYSEQSVKAAFTQLLGRSHRAANHQRKRLWLWLAALSVVSFFIMGAYYFVLFSTENSLQNTGALMASPATEVIEEPVVTDIPPEEIPPEELSSEEMVPEKVVSEKLVIENAAIIAAEKKPIPEKRIEKQKVQSESVRVAPEPAQQQAVIYAESEIDKFSQAIESGYATYQAGNWAQAREAYAVALKIKPNHRDAVMGSAAVAMREGRYQEALSWYQERLAIDPSNPDYTYNIAITLDQLVQPKEALGFYRQSLTLSQSRPASFDQEQIAQRIEQLEAMELEQQAP
jgi:tetratricopeptide (TPR) repeat protein